MRGQVACSPHSPVLQRFAIRLLTGAVLFFSLSVNITHAQGPPITPSGLHTQVSDPIAIGGHTQYDITGGTRPGGGVNLFHSFGDFNVPINNIANFLNAGSFDLIGTPLPPNLPTDNIFGRVTEQQDPSIIFGMIQTNGPGGFGHANLFLMNPHGFLFGPNATVNVGGMVAFTSADYMKLTDTARFNAIPNAAADALLTAFPVAAFGFLGSNPGAITVQGSQFTVADGTGISLVGGNISIESGTPEGGTTQPARLSAPNSQIQLASVASPGEFDAITLQPLPNVDGASFTSVGSVSLAPGSNINVIGTNTVSIRSGQFVLAVNDALLTTDQTAGPSDTIALTRGSSIVTSNAGTDLEAADISVTTGNFEMDGASMKSTTTGAGRGGDISVIAQSINLVNGAQIVSATEGPGTGGTISLLTTNNVSIFGYDSEGTLTGILDDVGFVRSGVFTTTSSSVAGGAIVVSAPVVTLEEGGMIASTTPGEGRGGNITINNGTTLNVMSGAQITSTSGVFNFETGEIVGSGDGGDITVTATDSVLVTGVSQDLFSLSAISATTSTGGKGGDITILAPRVNVEESGIIISSTAGTGTGGAIAITADDAVLVTGFLSDFLNSSIVSAAASDGAGGAITIDTPSLTVGDRGVIRTDSSGSGNGGALTVTAGNISLTNGGGIEASGGVGASGTISLEAGDTLLVSGQFVDQSGPEPDVTRSRIVNRTDNGLSSNGGIEIVAREVVITDGRIESQTGPGGGGDVSITADDAITISGGLNIQAFTLGGTVGSLSFSAPAIRLFDQAAVTSTTSSDASAGGILFTTNTLTLMDGSIIRSNTEQGTGRGGVILVDASNSVILSGGSTIQSNTTTTQGGPAGSVTVKANNLVSLSGTGTGLLSESGSNTTIGTGDGGTITVQSNQVQITDSAVISAKSNGTGNAGSVTIEGTASSAQSVLIDGGVISTETDGGGAGGDIQINATAIHLLNFASIRTLTFLSDGAAGDIALNATQQITAVDSFLQTDAVGGTGRGGDILLRAPTIGIDGGLLSATTSGAGQAGNVLLEGHEISLRASPFAAAQGFGLGVDLIALTAGSGHGGTVTLRGLDGPSSHADNVTISGSSSLRTLTASDGSAGDITINAARFVLTDDAKLNADTFGSGGAGTITITATDHATISGLSTAMSSSSDFGATGNAGQITVSAPTVTITNSGHIFTTTTGEGTGGNITITAGQSATLTNGAGISASSTGPGNTGNIEINAGNQFTMTDSSMTAEADQSSGGAIKITTNPGGTMQFANSTISTSVLDGTGGGGSLNFDPLFMIMLGSQFLANAVQGPGGNISITTNFLLMDANSVISASSQFGVNGTVTIQSPNAPVSGQIQPLNKAPLPATSLLNQRCAALAGGQFSSFTVAGRDSLPTEPGSWLTSPLYAAGTGTEEGLSGLSRLSGVSGVVRAGLVTHRTNQIDKTDQTDQFLLSLRQIAPAGFLTQAFAVNSSEGCTS